MFNSYEEICRIINDATGYVPTLDFEPESVESARARYPAALREVYDPLVVLREKQVPPSKKRSNVFDFEDDIRMIISVDVLHTCKVIHVSGCFTARGAETLLKQVGVNKSEVVEIARTTLEQRFEAIAPGMKLKFRTRTPVGAFHFIAEEK